MFLAAFEQIFRGAIHPLSEGRETVNAAIAYLSGHEFRESLGAVAAKLAAMNALPLPPLAGGMAILALVPISEDARNQISIVGLLIFLGALVSWIAALASALAS